MKSTSKLVTVKRLPLLYPDASITESSIRWLIFNAQTNEFQGCIRRMGRKVLIDVEAFERWLDKDRARPPERESCLNKTP